MTRNKKKPTKKQQLSVSQKEKQKREAEPLDINARESFINIIVIGLQRFWALLLWVPLFGGTLIKGAIAAALTRVRRRQLHGSKEQIGSGGHLVVEKPKRSGKGHSAGQRGPTRGAANKREEPTSIQIGDMANGHNRFHVFSNSDTPEGMELDDYSTDPTGNSPPSGYVTRELYEELETRFKETTTKLEKLQKQNKQDSLRLTQLQNNQQKQLEAEAARIEDNCKKEKRKLQDKIKDLSEQREDLRRENFRLNEKCNKLHLSSEDLERSVKFLKERLQEIEGLKDDNDEELKQARQKIEDALKEAEANRQQAAEDRQRNNELLELRIAQNKDNVDISEAVRPDTVTQMYKELQDDKRMDAADCLDRANVELEEVHQMSLLCQIMLWCRESAGKQFQMVVQGIRSVMDKGEQHQLREAMLIELRSELRRGGRKKFAKDIVKGVRREMGEEFPTFEDPEDQSLFDDFLKTCADLAWQMEILAEPLQLRTPVGDKFDAITATLYSGAPCDKEGTVVAWFWPVLVSGSRRERNVLCKGIAYTEPTSAPMTRDKVKRLSLPAHRERRGEAGRARRAWEDDTEAKRQSLPVSMPGRGLAGEDRSCGATAGSSLDDSWVNVSGHTSS